MSTSLRPKAAKTLHPAQTNPLGYRLRLEMKKRGVTSAELAKHADVKTSFIYDVISGKSANPSTIKLARVAEQLGIDLSYLVGGEQKIVAAAPKKQPFNDEYITVPRIAVDVSAGSSIVSIEQEGERYAFRKHWISEQLGAQPSALRLLYVRGDSMEPSLNHNDMLLVDTTKKTPSPPGIFVLFDGFGLIAKRLEYIEGGAKAIRIISDNAQYSTYERGVDETFVIGRVVWFAREI